MRVVFSALALAVLVLSSGCSVAGDEEITFDEDGEETVSLTPAEKMRQEAEDLLAVLVEKNVSYAPLEDPEGVYNLNTVKNVHMVEMLTGEYAQNHTKTNYGVGGTDLGVMINKGEETFIFFGDTFLNETQSENWRSMWRQ